MQERERLARVLHLAHSTWRRPHLLPWEDTDEPVRALYLCMASAVLVDRLERTVVSVEAMEGRIEAAERRAEEAEKRAEALTRYAQHRIGCRPAQCHCGLAGLLARQTSAP
jgi:hypothetical protein